ncbi:MAG: lamin tail domain-containing protein [Porphyromonadaceae bacterium]|nr:lamin tail domain-containing protein [Porphyromonadaceae bacterium]
MKKIFTYSLGALLLTTTLSLGSCKSQADDELTRRTEQSVNQGTPVVFTFDMESLSDQEGRALTIESQTAANGKNAGIKLTWEEGDTEKIHLIFKQGSKIEVVTTKIEIGAYNASSKRYEGKFEATPTTINLAAGGVTVAGVMGVSSIDKTTGVATISSSKFFGEADSFTTLPMYFTERPVKSNGTKYVADMTLHFFGSVVGVTVSNVGGNMTYSPHEVTFKTEAFTTAGQINVLAASEANSATGTSEVLPTWATDQTATTDQRVDFDHGDIKVGEKKTLFFWVHPSDYTGTKTFKLDVRTDNYDNNLGATDPEITKNFNVKPLSQRRVHRIAEALQAPKGDLIITEVYMGLEDYNTIWEIYNPTEETIDLTQYTMQRYDLKGSSYPSTPSYESSLTEFGKWKGTLLGAQATTLPPHRTIVYWPGSTIFNKAEVENRPGILYIANYVSTVFGGATKFGYGKAFLVPQYSRHALAKNGKIVDSFFYGDATTKYKIPSGNFMRKPGRNIPRKEMKIDVRNSDWVIRSGTARQDLGYRYSYYYDRTRLGTKYYGNHWLEDTQNKGTGNIDGNPIKNVDYSVDATRSTSSASATTNEYTPPTWWTKARAQAADR